MPGSRFTKKIPEKVYMCDMGNGWYGGPWVNKPKGNGEYMEFYLIPVNKEKFTGFSPEVEKMQDDLLERENRIIEKLNKLPKISEPKEITDAELQLIGTWLQSPEGREKIRTAQECAEKFSKALDEMLDINPEKLREPYNI